MYRYSVLLVEDNQLLRWWMSCCLQREGFVVVAPTSVEEAMSAASKAPYEVLITDWRLAEDHNGFEVLARVREKSPSALAILISAEASSELPERARALGFDLIIEKPFPVAEIVGAVRNLASVHGTEAIS